MLFITGEDGVNIELGEVDNFEVQVQNNGTDWQPVGDLLQYDIPTGITITLTFNEVVVRDDVLINPYLEHLNNGIFSLFAFQGKLRSRPDAPNSREERMIFKNCSPNGATTLMNLSPGEIVRRQWSFRVNAIPERIISML